MANHQVLFLDNLLVHIQFGLFLRIKIQICMLMKREHFHIKNEILADCLSLQSIDCLKDFQSLFLL